MTSEGINAGSQASIFITTSRTIAGGTVIHIETADGEGVLTKLTVGRSISRAQSAAAPL